MSRPPEFELISTYFGRGFPDSPDVIVPNGDDCSVIAVPAGYQLAQSIDTQVEDIHFPAAAPAHLIAGRALRCAASDLAAMGAKPHGFHLALTLPTSDSTWLQDFACGLRNTAQALNLPLLGGDTTRGNSLIITVSVQGLVPQGKAITRAGAQPGDDVWVSGVMGASALALSTVLETPHQNDTVTAPYWHPEVQFSLGQALCGIATSALDISDGLLQDAGHIAKASGVSLILTAADIPTHCRPEHPDWKRCLSGGDDYQLVFTAPLNARTDIERIACELGLKHCQRIGQAETGSGVKLLNHKGQDITPAQKGYSHF